MRALDSTLRDFRRSAHGQLHRRYPGSGYRNWKQRPVGCRLQIQRPGGCFRMRSRTLTSKSIFALLLDSLSIVTRSSLFAVLYATNCPRPSGWPGCLAFRKNGASTSGRVHVSPQTAPRAAQSFLCSPHPVIPASRLNGQRICLYRLCAHPVAATHDGVPQAVHEMVVVLDHLPLIIPAVQPEFLPEAG